MDQNKIGKYIEKYRKERKLTQQQLADILGVSNTAISKWENGNNLPDISMLEPLSKALKIDMLDLLTAQNSTHSQVSKKFVKQRRNKTIRITITVILAILLLITTNLITFSKCNKEKAKILSEQIQVYKISSKDTNYVIEGYLIFNNKENLVYIEKIAYQETESLNIDFSKIKEVNYSLFLNDSRIFNQTTHIEENTNSLTKLLKQYKGNSYSNYYGINKINKKDKVTLRIQLKNKNGNVERIIVSAKLKKSFINNVNI